MLKQFNFQLNFFTFKRDNDRNAHNPEMSFLRDVYPLLLMKFVLNRSDFYNIFLEKCFKQTFWA